MAKQASLIPDVGKGKPGCADCDVVLGRLRRWTGRPWRGKISYRQAHARHKEYGVEACISQIDWCWDSWNGNRKTEGYLTPQTILGRASKFAERHEKIQNGVAPLRVW